VKYKFLCKVWLSFNNGHHFSKTRIRQKHKHDLMTIEFMLTSSS